MTVLAIVGPTASGKSALAVAVAQRLGSPAEIIGTDSMQVYRGMDIGTATPTTDEQGGVRHHLIDVWEPVHAVSVAEFQEVARAAIDGVLALRDQGLTADNVEKIRVDGYRATLEVSGIDWPRTAAEAKFSTRYVVAHALVHGSVRLDAFSDERLESPEIRDLMARIELREDPALTALFPAQRAARVSAVTRDGRTLEHFAPCRKGDPEAPLTDAELEDKFLELVEPVLGPARTQTLLQQLWNLDAMAVADLRLAAP